MTFFQGSLQEGIAAALQQTKSVVCFVTDSEAESKQWEDEFFAEEEIRTLLQAQAVSLKLEAGSQGEGFLAQLYPLPKKPTAVIIKNGELKEYIAAGVSKDEFTRRMKAALTPAPVLSQPSPAQPIPTRVEPTAAPGTSTNQASHSDGSSTTSSGQATARESRVQTLLAERAARLAEKKKKDEEEAKRQRAEKAKAKAEAEANGLQKPDEQSKHAAALKKKQREAREERERILKAIEDDKAARRAKKAEAEAARNAATAAEKPDSAPFAPASQLLPSNNGRLSEHCSLQVRLFDGSTIRSRFSSRETLKDVRKWVDDTRGDGKEAYTFKVLLTPLPSKTIDVTEEDKTLQALELAPSATLILLRVPKYSAAYSSSSSSASSVAGAPQGNVFQRMIAYVMAIVTGFFGTLAAFFSTMLSTSGPPPAAAEPATSRTSQNQTAADAARRRGVRIGAVNHTDGRRNDQQFYNGNSTNFEPRPDDGE